MFVSQTVDFGDIGHDFATDDPKYPGDVADNVFETLDGLVQAAIVSAIEI